MLKNIIAGVSAIAMSISAFAGITLAAEPTYEMSLATGNNGNLAGKQRCVNVECNGMANKYVFAAQCAFSVPAGSIASQEDITLRKKVGVGDLVISQEWDDDAGEDVPVETWKTYDWKITLIADGEKDDIVPNDGNDTVIIVGGTDTLYYSTNDILFEVRFKQTQENLDKDWNITLEKYEIKQDANGNDYKDHSSFVQFAEDKNGNNSSDKYHLETAKKYTVTANTSTVTEASTTTTKYEVNKAATTNGSFTVDKTTAAENETVTITPTADAGYEVDTVTVKDVDGGDVTVTNNTFIMPAKAVTVTVTFKEKWDKNNDGSFQKKEYASTGDEASDNDSAYAFVQKLDSITKGAKYWLYAKTSGGKEYKYSKKQIELPNMTEGTIALGVVIQYDPQATDNLFNPADVTGFELREN